MSSQKRADIISTYCLQVFHGMLLLKAWQALPLAADAIHKWAQIYWINLPSEARLGWVTQPWGRYVHYYSTLLWQS